MKGDLRDRIETAIADAPIKGLAESRKKPPAARSNPSRRLEKRDPVTVA